MLAATVFNQLVSTLQGNVALGAYIKQVFKGVRYDVEPDTMPCIMVEITDNNDVLEDFGQIKKIWLGVSIFAYVNCPSDPDYGIVGQATYGYKGVLNVENDIRACLQASYTLGDLVEDLRMEQTEFMPFEMDGMLYRGLKIPVRVLYRQLNGV